jgi:hypothetical protein
MFLLIRYQIVVASTKEINFTRQFSNVSLVHRTETNIARQFFEFCPFIIAVQQNFRDASTKRLWNGSLRSTRRRWQTEMPAGCSETNLWRGRILLCFPLGGENGARQESGLAANATVICLVGLRAVRPLTTKPDPPSPVPSQ